MIALGQKLMIFISLYSLAHYSPSLPYGCDGGSVILERVILYDLHSSDFILQQPPPPLLFATKPFTSHTIHIAPIHFFHSYRIIETIQVFKQKVAPHFTTASSVLYHSKSFWIHISVSSQSIARTLLSKPTKALSPAIILMKNWRG